MKNKKWLLVILLILAAGAVIAYKYITRGYPKSIVTEELSSPLLAVYDAGNKTTAAGIAGTKHILLRWSGSGGEDLTAELKKQIAGSQPVIITVELWPAATDKFSKQNVLVLLEKGNYDEKIKGLGIFLNKENPNAMLRFDPDMEVYIDRYPWQKQAPAQYTNGFRHFSETIKKEAPAVKIVWSPAGYPGTEEYWPGGKWVDMVSVTLKGKSEGMTDNYPEEKTMWDLLLRKLHRMRFFDKPVLVMGSEKSGKKDFDQPAFDSVVRYLQQNRDAVYKDINAADNETSPDLLRKNGELQVGIFDPFNKLVDSVPLSTEHVFVNLSFLKTGLLKKALDVAAARGHDLILTMEPWKDKDLDKDPLLIKNILSGKYDAVFDMLYTAIASTDKKIYLRWLHEMEIPITRYPWQSQNPVEYIKAYRYFVNYIRSKNPSNVFFVWGPAGDRGSMEFWPGSDVVDYTSIAIYALPDKNISDHNKQESFNTIFQRKYRRIWFAHKPLFITEFGVKGPEAYKKKWLTEAAATIETNTAITGVSYFNDADNPKAWGDIEAPDWAIPPALYMNFRKQLTTSLKQ